MSARVLLLVALLTLAGAPVQAQLVFLQNDSYPDSGSVLCYNGADQLFESVAAKFTATPAQYPYTIDRIRVFACGALTQDTYSFQIYNDNADTANPGALIYSSSILYVLTGGSFNDILMSSEPSPPPPITSGTIRVAIYNQNLSFNPVGFGADLNGIIAHRNFVSDTGGNWSFAESQGVTGDFILRLGIVAPGAPPTLSTFDLTVNEGNAGTSQAVFTVALTGSSSQTVTVDYATADGTATAGPDYASASGTLSFPPGTSVTTVAVTVNGDTLDEVDETFSLSLTNPTNATIAVGQGTGTITDDDPPPALSISDTTVTEGNTGTTNAAFTVTLSAPSGLPISVGFATADGSATAPADYFAASGTVSFAPGETARPVTVIVSGDTLDEADETFFVNLTSPTNATIADAQGQGTITDDDPSPALSIGDTSLTEGNAGTTNASFAVTLSAPSGQAIAVTFATADGTATAPADYVAAAGTLTFAPGATTQPVTVAVNGDLIPEANETFFVNLTSPTNATIADPQGQGTIVDDDGQTTISTTDATVVEGNTGTTNATFTVTLSGPAALPVTVDFATADGTATAPADYAAISGTLTFAIGETTKPVAVAVNGDALDEPDETFFLNLTNAAGASIADPQGLGTITDDDPQPLLSIADTATREGANGTTTPATFAVTLSAASGQTVSVSYGTADGTATAGPDYQAAAGGLTLTPGATSGAVSVTVNGDDLREPDETFRVDLVAPTNAGLADGQGTGTIANDDAWLELTHGQAVTADLRAQPGPTPDADFYRLSQKPYASYEVVVDGASGDLGALGPAVERIASDGVTVLQGSLPVAGGSSRSLRFENATAGEVNGETVRVRGTSCTITCGPEDVYRIRLYETTAAVARFNNSASQVTVLSLQNLTGDLVAGHVRLWDGAGGLLATQPFSMPPHGNFVLNTASLPAAVGQSGSITVAVDAPYGALAGKSVAVEPSTGFSFDSPLVVRPR